MTELNTNTITDNANLNTVVKKGRVSTLVGGFEEQAKSWLTRKDALELLKDVLSKDAGKLKEIAAAIRKQFGEGGEPTTIRIQSDEERSVDVLYVSKNKALGKELKARVEKLPEALRRQLVEEVIEVKLKPREGAAEFLELLEPVDPVTAQMFRAHLAPEIQVKAASKSTL